MSQGDETARTREALKAGVAASVHDLIEEAQRLNRGTRLLVWVAGAAVVLVAVIAVLVGINQFQVRHIAHQNRNNGNAIRDCTTPNHECSDRNARATSAALEVLARADCAGEFPADLPRQRQCVDAALKVLSAALPSAKATPSK